MRFRKEYTISRFVFSLDEGVSLHFAYSAQHPVTVELRRPTDVERAHDQQLYDAWCMVVSDREPPPKVRPMFDSIAERRLPQGSKKPDASFSGILLDADGTVKAGMGFPWQLLPDGYKQFSNVVSKELHDYANKTVRTLRWLEGAEGSHNPIRSAGKETEFSLDGESWHPMPTKVRTIPGGFRVPTVSDERRADVVAFVEMGVGEPLGHELYREAWHQQTENPRSALSMGMAAAEVGFKQAIGTLVPDARWLAENVQTPPLVQMLTDYLPMLPARCQLNGAVLPPPKRILDALKKGVYLRNKVVHAGSAAPSQETLNEVLLAVRDVLWLLDFYSGFPWTLGYVRSETLEAMGLSGIDPWPAVSALALPTSPAR